MIDSGIIISYFRNGLAYISISQINNKDNNVPVILSILINDFYSIFIEKNPYNNRYGNGIRYFIKNNNTTLLWSSIC